MPATPTLLLQINYWTLWNKFPPSIPGSEAQRIATAAQAGFEAYTCPANTPHLKELLAEHQLRFGAALFMSRVEEFAPQIAEGLAIDDGPINVQLGSHDTPVEEAIQLAVALMDEADHQGALVHIETHRGTCTETPEKTSAIAEGVKAARGVYPRINFDYSHPACFKHLGPHNYADRLINTEQFQASTLWHMRPFNGHHAQVPVTDGQGIFSPEYEGMRPFIHHLFDLWLDGPRPNNELWVCPELGPTPGYGLSCFPDIWEDAIALGSDLRIIWAEALAKHNL